MFPNKNKFVGRNLYRRNTTRKNTGGYIR